MLNKINRTVCLLVVLTIGLLTLGCTNPRTPTTPSPILSASPTPAEPNYCRFNSGFSCYDYRVTEGGILYLDLGESVGEDLFITEIACSTGTNSSFTPLNITIPSGSHKVIPVLIHCLKSDGTYPNRGEYYQGKLHLNFTGIDTQMSHAIVGEIAFRVE